MLPQTENRLNERLRRSISRRPARVCLNRLLRLPVLLAAVAAGAAEPADNQTPVTLNVGFVSASFQNVNRADAESAFEVLAKTVGHQRGYCVTTRTEIFDTAADIEAAVKTGGSTWPSWTPGNMSR